MPLYFNVDDVLGQNLMERKPDRVDRRTVTVYIVPSDKSAITALLRSRLADTRFLWMYLGKDITFDDSVRTLIGNDGERVSIAQDMQLTARKFRHEYIRFIGELMPEGNPLSWWLSGISEKNPFTFNLYLQFCYISACLNYIPRCDRDLVVICESRGLVAALEKNLLMRGVPILVHDPVGSKLWSGISLVLTGICHLGWYAIRYSARALLANVFSWLKKDRKLLRNHAGEWICLHSWTDKRSFGTHTFADVYFGSLGDTLASRKFPVIFLVDVLPTFPYLQALINLYKTEKRVILLEEFISPVDVIASFVSVKEPALSMETMSLNGIDVSLLVGELQRKSAYDPRTRWAFLCYRAAIRIQQYSPPARFIYTFENHIWEKMFILGFRKSPVKTKIVGYAHTIVNTMYTNYAISEKEAKLAPLPDRIIVNGTGAATLLATSGFDPATIVIGGSLRYAHLTKMKSRHAPGGTDKTVLVTTSAELSESLELIRSALQVFGGHKMVSVVIKCHPTVPYSYISGLLSPLPGNFRISEEPLENLLSNADLLLYTSSASVVEAFALGVPVIHVKSEYRIDMNIFDDVPEIPSLTGEQLTGYRDRFFNETPVTAERRKEIVEGLFRPPDKASYFLFVDG
jgi:hypothetical protein